jgi:glycosyltransferase involved in cell wall biosynthesis
MRAYTVARELGIELESVNVASLDELAGMESFDIALVAGSEILPPVPPLARRTFYYCHVPFGVPSGELARRWAWWNRYERCLVSSDRVRQTIIASLRELHLPEKPLNLIPPPSTPLNVQESSLCSKENIILHVGHFCEGDTSKHQDKLISAFGTLLDGGIMAQLHLVGVVQADMNSRNFFLYCRKITNNLPVYFHPNVPRQQLEALYRRSACFWAWAGENKHQTTPGWIAASARISIREAQSAGCICVIVDGNAGLGEVQNGLDGFVVDGAGDLVRLTHRALMEKDAPWATDMRSRAVERAGSIFASFQERCRELVSSGAAQEH